MNSYYGNIINYILDPGAQRCDVTQRLWFQCPLEGMNYYLLIFSFLRSGAKAKGLNPRFPLPCVCGIQREDIIHLEELDTKIRF